MKKTKKQKEKGEEEAAKETGEKQEDKLENETEVTKEAKQDEEADEGMDDSSYRTPNVVNMPTGEQKPLIRQDISTGQRVPATSAIPQEQESSRSAKNEERASEKETAKGYFISFFTSFEFFLPIVNLMI